MVVAEYGQRGGGVNRRQQCLIGGRRLIARGGADGQQRLRRPFLGAGRRRGQAKTPVGTGVRQNALKQVLGESGVRGRGGPVVLWLKVLQQFHQGGGVEAAAAGQQGLVGEVSP